MLAPPPTTMMNGMMTAASYAFAAPMIFGMSAGSGESSGTYAALHTTCARYATAPTVAWISAMRNHVSAVRKICTT